MDLKTIRTFKEIVKYGNFQRAAEELNYAQSTVTTHIKNLEADLGAILINRGKQKGKQLELTDAGRLLLEKADVLLDGFQILQQSMEELISGKSGMIRIGVMEPTASYRFPEIIKSFLEKHPNVHVSVQIHSVKVLNDMLESEEIDLALCPVPEQQHANIFQPLFYEEVVLLLPAQHELAGKEQVFLHDLKEEQLLMTSSFCPFRKNLEKHMMNAGVNPTYGIEVSNLMALKHYVAQGFGMGVVPAITVDPPPSGTVTKVIEDFKNGLSIGILSNESEFRQTEAVQYMRQAICRHLADNGIKQINDA